MRLISQDGLLDVNYENVCLRIGKELGANGIFIFAYSEMMQPTQVAWYSTQDKARRVFEELQKKFLEYTGIINNDIGYRTAYDHPKVFQFPRDEEVDVVEDKDHISRKYAIEQMDMAIKGAATEGEKAQFQKFKEFIEVLPYIGRYGELKWEEDKK